MLCFLFFLILVSNKHKLEVSLNLVFIEKLLIFFLITSSNEKAESRRNPIFRGD